MAVSKSNRKGGVSIVDSNYVQYPDGDESYPYEVPLIIRLNEELRPKFERKLEEYKERQETYKLEYGSESLFLKAAISMVSGLLHDGYTVPWLTAAGMMRNLSGPRDVDDAYRAVQRYGPIIANYASDNVAGMHVHGSW